MIAKVDIVALMRRDLIELTFVRGTAVVFSHSGSSWTSPDGIERAIRSELTRARMSAAESLGEHRIDRLILIGTPDVTSAVTRSFFSLMIRSSDALIWFHSASTTVTFTVSRAAKKRPSPPAKPRAPAL